MYLATIPVPIAIAIAIAITIHDSSPLLSTPLHQNDQRKSTIPIKPSISQSKRKSNLPPRRLLHRARRVTLQLVRLGLVTDLLGVRVRGSGIGLATGEDTLLLGVGLIARFGRVAALIIGCRHFFFELSSEGFF